MIKLPELIGIKEFSKRTPYSEDYARQLFHSKDLRPFVSQRAPGCKLMLNWTEFSLWWNTTKKIAI